MGQYYIPVIISGNKRMRLYSHQYDNGIKLMEHSYIGNNFMNAVCSLLLDRPAKVAWIGDYSADFTEDMEPYETKLPQKKFMRIYNATWTSKKREYVKPEPMQMDIDTALGWWLVNHTQKIALDLGKYVAENKWRKAWKDWKTGETEEYDMCVHPLSLLTACGNGRGGGDYHDCHPDYDKVGTWAFDRIQLMTEKPNGYAEVTYHFTEREGADGV